MRKVLHMPETYYYQAEDGRKFQNEQLCTTYEYLCNKWLGKRVESINTDDTKVFYYPVTSYEDLREIADFEHLHDHNYMSIHPQESYYQIPGWVVTSYNCYDDGHPDIIEPLSYIEDCIKDVEDTLDQMRKDIARLKEDILK